MPLLVDEAHGAHLSLHPALPAGALACGADAVAQSTHKTLSALTQAAMLHVRGGRVCADRVARALQVVQVCGGWLYVLSAHVVRWVADVGWM